MILPCLCIKATVSTPTLQTWRDEEGEQRDEAEQHHTDGRSCLLPAEPSVSGSVCERVWFLLFVFRRSWSQQFHPHHCPSSCHLTESISYMLSCCVCVCVCVYRTFLDLALVSVMPLLYLSSVSHRHNVVIGWKQCVSAAWGKNNCHDFQRVRLDLCRRTSPSDSFL